MESFKQQMPSFDVIKQNLYNVFKTYPQNYFVYEQLLNELIEKHSKHELNSVLNECAKEEVIENRKPAKGYDI